MRCVLVADWLQRPARPVHAANSRGGGGETKGRQKEKRESGKRTGKEQESVKDSYEERKRERKASAPESQPARECVIEREKAHTHAHAQSRQREKHTLTSSEVMSQAALLEPRRGCTTMQNANATSFFIKRFT